MPHAAAPTHAMVTRLYLSASHGDGHLQDERRQTHDGDQGEDPLGVEPEVVADLGQQDAEGGAVELVDGVETEQHDDGEDRPGRPRCSGGWRAGDG